MIMLLTCTSISVMAADTQSDTTNQDGKMTIGVSVYNLNDAEVRAFRNYFENYVRAYHGEEEFLVKISEVRRILKLMDAVRESGRTGKSIDFE